MTPPARAFELACDETSQLLPKARALASVVNSIAATMVACWDGGGKILIAGNGGSAADAIHFSEELVVRYKRNRRPLASIALLDSAAITCAGNDFGFDTIFSRQVEGLGRPGDVFIGFSTSGNSENIRRAFEVARAAGLKTIGFFGKDGGCCRGLCNVALVIPSESTARIQEMHQLAYHALCEYFDDWAGA